MNKKIHQYILISFIFHFIKIWCYSSVIRLMNLIKRFKMIQPLALIASERALFYDHFKYTNTHDVYKFLQHIYIHIIPGRND